MAATTSSISVSSPSSSLSSSSRRYLSTLVHSQHCSFLRNNLTLNKSLKGSPSFRVAAVSMAPQTQEKGSYSFLDRKESGFLHFVKYHGLGNDFILVCNSPFIFRITDILSELKMLQFNFSCCGVFLCFRHLI